MCYNHIGFLRFWSDRMQKEFTESCSVFESDGMVRNAGWAKKQVFRYDPSSRHSQRDTYYVSSSECAMYLSIENLGAAFGVKIALADLKRGGVVCDSIIKKHKIIKKPLPDSADGGEFEYEDKWLKLKISDEAEGKNLKCVFYQFGSLDMLSFDIFLLKNNSDVLDQLAPFERNRKYYYLKRFMPCYQAQGFIKAGSMVYKLGADSARAYFDRTRFRKPRLHNYQRLSSDCVIGRKRFTICLASRVGDNRYGNENCYFVDGNLHKLSQIAVKGTPKRIDRPVFFHDKERNVDISFKPFTVSGKAMVADMGKTAVVFGRLYGTIKQDEQDKPLVLDNAVAHLIFTEF